MTTHNEPVHSTSSDGLTKREYFAALAMQGILSNPLATENINRNHYGVEKEYVANEAIKIADTLIYQLNK